MSASGLSSTGRRPSASADAEGRAHLAAGHQHRAARRRTARAPDPLGGRLAWWSSRRVVVVVAARAEQHGAGQRAAAGEEPAPRHRRGQVGGHRGEPILRPMSHQQSAHRRCRWWSTGSRWRSPTTARRCSTCCATGSATGRRRTGAARRASAAAARCWSTGSRGSRASRPPGACTGARSPPSTGSPPRTATGGPPPSAPPGPASAASARPGIVCRLEGLRAKQPDAGHAAVEQALLAHLCRCTGWRTILDAWDLAQRDDPIRRPRPRRRHRPGHPRDGRAAGRGARRRPRAGRLQRRHRAGRRPRRGARRRGRLGGRRHARRGRAAGRQGAGPAHHRRRRAPARAPAGRLGGDAAHQLGGARLPRARRVVVRARRRAAHAAGQRRRLRRQGALGRRRRRPDAGRRARPAGARAARPGGRRAARARSARRSPAAPTPTAGASLRVVRTPGIAAADRVGGAATSSVEEVDVPGPPTSTRPARGRLGRGGRAPRRRRGAGGPVTDPTTGAVAEAEVADGAVRVRVDAGEPLDEVVLRSYATGAAHMALSWLSREGIAVDDGGHRPRPHHPILRRAARRRHPADRGGGRRRARRAAGARRRRRVRRGGGRRLAPPRLPDRLADRRPLALTDCDA